MTPWTLRLARAQAVGVCVRCPAPCPEDADLCPACALERRDAQDARRDAYVAQGRCRCGQATMPDMRQCGRCQAWDRDRERWRDRPRAGEAEQLEMFAVTGHAVRRHSEPNQGENDG